MKKDSKQRLFEMMGKVDTSFRLDEKIKLSSEETEASRTDYNKFIEMMKRRGFDKKDRLWIKNGLSYVLSPEGEFLFPK